MNTGKTLTFRYALALSLVAFILIVTHVMEARGIGDTADDARTINVSGMQRMLSQRTALLARELSMSDDVSTSEELTAKLAEALDTMEANHDALAAGWHRRAGRGEADYLALVGDDGLDGKVRRYIATARSLLARHDPVVGPTSYGGSDLPRDLAVIARNGFLAELDAVVKRYERESVEKTKGIARLTLIATLIGLALLFVEALFIFRPMVRRIASTVSGLERANAKLEEANEELAQFNYRVSHDIVSPISSARGYLELAIAEVQDPEPDPAELLDLMTVSRNQLDRLNALVVDLSSLARAGMDGSRIESIALQPLVDALSDEQLEATLDGFAIDTDLALTEIDSDPVRIRQMLANLVDNAAKYRDVDEATPGVTVRSLREGSSDVLEVSDNGIGIDPEFGDSAFDMFARGTTSAPGTGLGLYIIGKHADRLGGSVTIASFAKPTTLRITLPPTARAAA